MSKKDSYTYKPVRFFFITNLITWAVLMTAAYLSYQQNAGFDYGNLVLVAMAIPFCVALWMILTSGSKELKQDFYNKLFNLKLIKLSSLPGIFLLMPLTVVISVLVSRLFGQSLDQFKIAKMAFSVGFIPAPLVLFSAPFFEEVGWKGYGINSLRGRRNFFVATLMFGALWAFWHLPLFFINNYYQNTLLKTNPLFALNFIVSMFPAAFIINWLWYKNRGSILTAVFFHAVTNFQGVLEMGQIAKCIQTIVLIVIAIIIVSRNKKMFFGEFPARIGYFGEETPSS